MQEEDEFAALSHPRRLRREVVNAIKRKWALMKIEALPCEQCKHARAATFDGDFDNLRCLCTTCARNAKLDHAIANQRATAAWWKARRAGR